MYLYTADPVIALGLQMKDVIPASLQSREKADEEAELQCGIWADPPGRHRVPREDRAPTSFIWVLRII